MPDDRRWESDWGYLPRGDFIVSDAGLARAVTRGCQTTGNGLLDTTRYSGQFIGANMYGFNSGGDSTHMVNTQPSGHVLRQ